MGNEYELTKEEQKIVDGLVNEEDKKLVIGGYRQQKEWENSLDGVYYQLGELAVASDLESCIVKTVLKLPPKVREFIYDKCQFTSVEPTGGQAVYMRTKKNRGRPWLIILSGDKVSEDYESVIAHEIAHTWLGHKGAPDTAEILATKQEEVEACFYAKQWGFVGSGTEIDKAFEDAEKRIKKLKKDG